MQCLSALHGVLDPHRRPQLPFRPLALRLTNDWLPLWRGRSGRRLVQAQHSARVSIGSAGDLQPFGFGLFTE